MVWGGTGGKTVGRWWGSRTPRETEGCELRDNESAQTRSSKQVRSYSSYGAAAGSPQVRRLQYFKLRVALTLFGKLKLQVSSRDLDPRPLAGI